jgi:hypothetical protein
VIEKLRLAVPAAAAALALAAAGCGLGSGDELGGGAELRVTRDFGQELLYATERDELREGDTAMRLLQSEREVEFAYGGGFVQSIHGLSGEGSGGSRDWFYFVNGLEADVGAADYGLSRGDVVQWDYRYWAAAMRVPAIVGAYPEPFLHGSEGERIPTRVECEDDSSAACDEVKQRLASDGVNASGAPLGAAAGEDVLRVIVATWPAARVVRAAQAIERGPAESGVFARFSEDGSELSLLDERGEEAAVESAGAGLVAATELPDQQPVWVVTGVDEAGVEAAAAALDEDVLRDAFAVAVTAEGRVPLPVAGRGVEGSGTVGSGEAVEVAP